MGPTLEDWGTVRRSVARSEPHPQPTQQQINLRWHRGQRAGHPRPSSAANGQPGGCVCLLLLSLEEPRLIQSIRLQVSRSPLCVGTTTTRLLPSTEQQPPALPHGGHPGAGQRRGSAGPERGVAGTPTSADVRSVAGAARRCRFSHMKRASRALWVSCSG